MSTSRVVLALVSLLAVAPAAPAVQGDPLAAELEATLLAEDGVPAQGFGSGVAVSGDTVVVGSRYDDELAWDAGSAYVFVRSGTTWTQQAKLLAPDAHEHDYFGWSVAISGDTIVVGAPGYDEPAPPLAALGRARSTSSCGAARAGRSRASSGASITATGTRSRSSATRCSSGRPTGYGASSASP